MYPLFQSGFGASVIEDVHLGLDFVVGLGSRIGIYSAANPD